MAAVTPRPSRDAEPARVASPGGGPALLPALLVTAAAGLLLGGATSFAQTVLPAALSSLANSSSGWTLLTVLVVALLRARPAVAALLGPVSFTGLVVGYQLVSGWRGYPTDEVLLLVVGLVVGPAVGLATAWLRERGVRAAVGCAALAGIGIGEGAFGLLILLQSTSPVYWALVATAGIALTAVVCARSLRGVRQRLLCVGLTVAVAVAVAFVAVFSSL